MTKELQAENTQKPTPETAKTATAAASPENDLMGTVVDAGTDLIPGVKSYKCIQKGDYLGAAIWGGLDAVMVGAWIFPPAGAGATAAITGLKLASTTKKGVSIATKALPIMEKMGLGKMVTPLAERIGAPLAGAAAGLTGTISEKVAAPLASAAAPLLQNLTEKASANIASNSLKETASSVISTAATVADKANPVKQATLFAANKLKDLEPVAQAAEKFSPYTQTVGKTVNTLDNLRKANSANYIGGIVADTLHVPDPIRDATKIAYRSIKSMVPKIGDDNSDPKVASVKKTQQMHNNIETPLI